ncbi:MAG TPA: hypothetical protein DCF33_05750, partial [Saprospirales bacterium]|nr:hypothetical protein [Saprospirales bacterium]
MTSRTSTPSTEKTLEITRLRLGLHLPAERIALLRKTVSAIAGETDDLLHNHASREKVIYRYPLIQYKSVEDNALILGVGSQGRQSLENLMTKPDFKAIFLENSILEVETDTYTIKSTPSIPYRLHHYIALNSSNLRQWQEQNSLPARAALLERCITGHILKFCSAVQWLLPPKSLKVELLDFRLDHTHAFNNPFLAFEVPCRSNISLPDHIGLGKAVSHG